MAEWLKAMVSKTIKGLTLSEVRILLRMQVFLQKKYDVAQLIERQTMAEKLAIVIKFFINLFLFYKYLLYICIVRNSNIKHIKYMLFLKKHTVYAHNCLIYIKKRLVLGN